MRYQHLKSPLIWLAGLIFLCAGSPLFGQQQRSHNIGNMFYLTNEGLTLDDMSWPASWADASTIYGGIDDGDLDLLQNHGIIIGARRTWTDPLGVQHDFQIAQSGENKFTDIELVMVPVSGAFTRTYRNPFPSKTLDGSVRTDILASGDPSNASAAADVVIYNKMALWPDFGMNMDLERWSYSFANNDHDDYVINEYVLTNTGSETRSDVILTLTAQTSASSFFGDRQWGDYYGVTYDDFVGGDASADSMRIWYSWDANEPSITADTKGDTDPLWGTLQEPQYAAYVVLHADASSSDESDNPALPFKAGWSQRDLSPNLNEETHAGMYRFISEEWAAEGSNQTGYSIFTDGDGNPSATGFYRTLDPNVDVRNFDPLTEQEKSGMFAFGPYEIGAGEDIRVVVAFAAASIPLRTAIAAGRAYSNGAGGQFATVPLSESITDLSGNVIAAAGSNLTKDQKDAIIDLGKDLVFNTASKAVNTWKNSSVRSGSGSFNVPFAPAAPSLEGFSENDQIRLTWGGEAESDNRSGSVAGYRIYRDYKRATGLDSDSAPTDTTFFLLADESQLGAGSREYIDTNVNRGEDYYYYVTAVTADGVESSPFLNRTGTSSNREDEALTPTRSPSANWMAGPDQGGVVVVPNPLHVEGVNKYPGDSRGRRLNFLNLPAYANINVYNMTGDLIQTLRHDSNTGDRDWERQDTFSTVEIVSGVYIYVVEELNGPSGQPTGNKAIGKFVVVK